MITTGIITAPRDGACYLGLSVESFRRLWDYRPYIFAEPGSPNPCPRDEVIWREASEPRGIMNNWFFALTTLVRAHDTPYYLLCEDDVYWERPDAANRMRNLIVNETVQTQHEEVRIDKCAFVSPYCSKVNGSQRFVKKDWWQRPRKPARWGWCGALALLFPRTSVEIVLNNYDRFIELGHGDSQILEKLEYIGPCIHLDYAIGQLLLEHGREPIAHMPTLVTHLGAVSTLGVAVEEHDARKPLLGGNDAASTVN